MPFIGNKPTAVPLSGADIQDGTITSADLQSGVIQNQSAFKNIIINGDMSIAQRGTSESGITSSGYHTVDRWRTALVTGGTWTQTQETDVPTGQGFAKSMKLDCTTANGSLSASSLLIFRTLIEGQNLQYLKKGTSSAESLTLSFWVKSNKTGTYTASIYDNDNSRQIAKSYTIDASDTWEKKTITYAGDTIGAFDNDNNKSLYVDFYLVAGSNYTSGTLATAWESYSSVNSAVGQVNLADSTSNYINITGVQLEAGTTASDFEFLPVDVNLDRCLRYYQVVADATSDTQVICNAASYSTSSAFGVLSFIKEMRAAPSLDQTSGSAFYNYSNNGNSDTFDSFIAAQGSTKNIRIVNADSITITAGQSGWFSARTTGGILALDAEL